LPSPVSGSIWTSCRRPAKPIWQRKSRSRNRFAKPVLRLSEPFSASAPTGPLPFGNRIAAAFVPRNVSCSQQPVGLLLHKPPDARRLHSRTSGAYLPKGRTCIEGLRPPWPCATSD
jgi:hypothetical protein